MKKDIFDLLRSLEEKSQKFNEMFGGCEFLDDEIEIVWKIIEDSFGLKPSDESIELLYEFGMGNISKGKLKSKLNKLYENTKNK